MGRMKELMGEHGDELVNLPEDAFEPWAHRCEINKHWLKSASEANQRVAMYGWFKRNYYYPFELSKAGMTQWVLYSDGGPFQPENILWAEFGKYANNSILMEVIAELQGEAPNGWVTIPYHSDDEYDEDFGVEVEDVKQPFTALHDRLDEIRAVLALTGSDAGTALAQKLAYSAVITALESYLWETMSYAVVNDPKAVKNIITKFQFFNQQKFSLGAIYAKMDSLETLVKAYLQDTVWHKWDAVEELFSRGLGIKPPSFEVFTEPTIKRHDIIHRSGHTKDGEPIIVRAEEIEALIREVTSFAIALEGDLLIHYAETFDAEMAAELAATMPNPDPSPP